MSKRVSLFDHHLRLIDNPEDTLNPEWGQVELRRHRPPPKLNLESTSMIQRNRYVFLAFVAAAAAIALIWTNQFRNESIGFKGSAKVFVVIESSRDIAVWDGKTDLQIGDRVNADVLTTQDALAFVAIYDRNGRLLSSRDSIGKSKLTLTAGVRGHFKSAFELTTENDGEQLVTIICDKSSLEKDSEMALKSITDVMQTLPKNDQMKRVLPFCGMEQFKLRR